MRVTAFIGNAQKRHTFRATELFLEKLQSLGDVETELVRLSDYHLGTCKGCRLCIDKGKEHCPLKDDRDLLLQKITDSDGVIFATPNYSFQVSGWMKIFLDRMGYLFHRPAFFGRTFTCVVNEGIYGGKKIVDYLNFVGFGLGFHVVKGSRILTIVPVTEEMQKKNDRIIGDLARKFYRQLTKDKYPSPSLLRLFLFRMARSSMGVMLNEQNQDFLFYMKNGWFESDYYYPVKMGLPKRWFGRLIDIRVAHVARNKGKVGIF